MPRLTQHNYIQLRAYLTKLWREDPSALASLPPAAQSDLHLYYAPTSDLDPSELARHRETVSRDDPSLPQRAGKAFRRLQHTQATGKPSPDSAPRHQRLQRRVTADRRGAVKITPTLRSEPDLDALAEAVLLQLGVPEPSEQMSAPHTQTAEQLVIQSLQRHIRELQQRGTCTWSDYLTAIGQCHISWVTAPEYSQLIAREGVSVGKLLPEGDRPEPFRPLNDAFVDLGNTTSRADELWRVVFDLLVANHGAQR